MDIYTWHTAGLSQEALPEGKLTEVVMGGKRIGLVRRDGQILAFAAACPHAGAALCAGWIDGLGRIVCPEHKYRFDPVNGRNTSGEGYKLFTYPVRMENGEIEIGIRELK